MTESKPLAYGQTDGNRRRLKYNLLPADYGGFPPAFLRIIAAGSPPVLTTLNTALIMLGVAAFVNGE